MPFLIRAILIFGQVSRTFKYGIITVMDNCRYYGNVDKISSMSRDGTHFSCELV